MKISPRKLAYLALLQVIFFQKKAEQVLSSYQNSIDPLDMRLARLITHGTIRRLSTLDFFLSPLGVGKLKKKEKLLLQTALYQYVFMEKIPLYAICDETVCLCKQFFGRQKGSYFNAIIRKFTSLDFKTLLETQKERLDIYYSYPEEYISLLLNEYGEEETKKILDAQNQFFPLMIRSRKEGVIENPAYEGLFSVGASDKSLSLLSLDDSLYIQNVSFVKILEKLFHNTKKAPQTILDLCAAPGGKLLLAHDLFPSSHLFANDISPKRAQKLQENLSKYRISAELTIGPGQNFPEEKKFDLILLDVPCSNSGVFHKRSEARWRFSLASQKELIETQKALLKKAHSLLSPTGQIWYMTCSILQKENEEILSFAKTLGLKVDTPYKILPDLSGSDGAFACALSL